MIRPTEQLSKAAKLFKKRDHLILNWSAFSTNASMEKCAPDVRQPLLMVEYTGDNSVFPTEASTLFESLGSVSKERVRVHGNHHGRPIDPEQPNGQVIAGAAIAEWLAKGGFA